MATAKKTPSGQWKVRVYSHTDADGKKHYRAFTATTKQEAEQQAAKFSGSNDRAARVDLTVAEAIDGYISAKEGVLSPSTVRGYRQMQRCYYDSIGHEKLIKLSNERLQIFVSDLSKSKSPKTVKNAYGLITSTIEMYMPDKSFKVKLPQNPKRRKLAPSDDVVMALYHSAHPWMKLCIGLAAFCGMRRGEISALKYGDIEGSVAHIHADMVQNDQGAFHYKEMPKTVDSTRDAFLPQELLDMIGDGPTDEFIIKEYTGSITSSFAKLCRKLGIKGVRFHDLRGYYASVGATLIPESYLARFGGWTQSSGVMKEVYQHEIKDATAIYSAKMTEHFSSVIKSMTQNMT